MRISMVTGSYVDVRHGGLENHIYYLSRALIRAGHTVTVYRVSSEPSTVPPPDDVPPTVISAGQAGPIVRSLLRLMPGRLSSTFLGRIAQNLSWRRAYNEITSAHGSDGETIIHQHDFLASVALTKRLSRRYPVVWTNHLGEFLVLRHAPFGPNLLTALTSHYGAVLAPSSELADLPWMADSVKKCPNGFDTSMFHRPARGKREEIRRSLGWRLNEFVVLIPRRWAPTKGVIVAAEAAGMLTERPYRFIFAGAGGSLYPSYSSDVNHLLSNVAHPVEVHDRLMPSDLARYYQAADVTLIPSFLEATSLAALEAMGSACIVIASAIGGLPELIEDGRTGILVPPGSAPALAAAIARVASMSAAERRSLGQEAWSHVRSRYSWEAVAEVAISAYARAIERRHDKDLVKLGQRSRK